jgi:hypothetical protein
VNNKPIWKDKPIFALKDPFFFLIKNQLLSSITENQHIPCPHTLSGVRE